MSNGVSGAGGGCPGLTRCPGISPCRSGHRIPVARPRVRAAGGSGELHLPGYDLFSSTEILGRLALEKMSAGLSSRRYARGLESAGQAVEAQAASMSKSAVWRRFVTATETAIEEGSTENAALVTDLITGLRERGPDVTRPVLAVLDASKASRARVRDVFDRPLIQRCQQPQDQKRQGQAARPAAGSH